MPYSFITTKELRKNFLTKTQLYASRNKTITISDKQVPKLLTITEQFKEKP